MERDCSGWFLRYRVDLDAMLNMYPGMVLDRGDPMGRLYYGCFPLYVLHGERNEDSYAVLHIPGKIVRYNFVANTFKLLFDFDPPSNVDYFLRYHAWSGAFPFIASLSCVKYSFCVFCFRRLVHFVMLLSMASGILVRVTLKHQVLNVEWQLCQICLYFVNVCLFITIYVALNA